MIGSIPLRILSRKGTHSCSSRTVIHKFHCFDKANCCMETESVKMKLGVSNAIIQRHKRRCVRERRWQTRSECKRLLPHFNSFEFAIVRALAALGLRCIGQFSVIIFRLVMNILRARSISVNREH